MTAPGPEVRVLAAAVAESLDVPEAATIDGGRDRDRLLDHRAMGVRSALRYLAGEEDADVAIAVECIRRDVARFPVRYTVAESAEVV